MFKAIKENKIIAICEKDSFPCLIFDSVEEDSEHKTTDFICIGEEFVLTDSPAGIKFKNQERIEELKQLLADADYWGQKYIDGEYTPEEWEEKKAQRKAWREEIRSLENSTDSDG